MLISPQILKKVIREVIQEVEEDGLDSKLKTTSMSGGSFGKSGKEQRTDANAELSNIERGIINQVDQFLLKLATQPNVELGTQKMAIQRVMKVLQNALVKQQPQGEQK